MAPKSLEKKKRSKGQWNERSERTNKSEWNEWSERSECNEWSDWKWTDEHNCWYRTRHNSSGEIEYHYSDVEHTSNTSTVYQEEPQETDARGRTERYSDPSAPREPSIDPTWPRPPTPTKPDNPAPTTSSSADASLLTFAPMTQNTSLYSEHPSYSQEYPDGEVRHIGKRDTFENFEITVQGKAAHAINGTQNWSFMSEAFATRAQLRLQHLPKRVEKYYYKTSSKGPKHDKQVKVIMEAKADIDCSGLSISDQRFYIIPKGERSKPDIVLGKDLTNQITARAPQAPPALSLAFRTPTTQGHGYTSSYAPYNSAAGYQSADNYPVDTAQASRPALPSYSQYSIHSGFMSHVSPEPLQQQPYSSSSYLRSALSEEYPEQNQKGEGSIIPAYHSGSTTSGNESNTSPVSDTSYTNSGNYSLSPGARIASSNVYQTPLSNPSDPNTERIQNANYIRED